MTKPKLLLNLILLFIPVAVFLFIFSYFGLDIPFEDDIGIIHSLMMDLPKAITFQQKICVFFTPQNEHPVVVYKFFVWLYYLVFSTINIKHINLIGNLIFLSSIGFFYRQLQIIKVLWVWLIPIVYILLSLYSYENATWALCSFQHTAIISLFLGGMYFCILYKETSYQFYLGVFLLACTSVSSGNGFLGFLIVFIFFLFEKRFLGAFIIGSLLAIIKFFLINNALVYKHFSFRQFIVSFLTLCGSIIKVSTKDIFIITIGGIVVICMIFFLFYGLFSKINKQEKPYFLLTSGLCLFVLGTFAGIAFFRNIDSSAFPDRYRVYTHLLWIALYLFTIPFVKKIKYQKPLFRLAVVAGICYFVHSFYIVMPNVLFSYHQRILIPINYYYANTALSGCYYREYFDKSLRTLAARNIYHLPEPMFDSRIVESVSSPLNLNITNIGSESIHLSSSSNNSSSFKERGIFILLKDSANIPLLFPVLQDRSLEEMLFFPGNDSFKGFQTLFSKTCFPKDLYTAQIAILNNKRLFLSENTFLFDSRNFKIITN